MVQMIEVLSSNLAAVGYDPLTQVLFVRFRCGSRLYRYHLVPPSVFEVLLESPSKGKFVAASIRDHYPYDEVA